MDIEKVIKGLECLARKQERMANPCSKCDYHDRPNFAFCVVDVATDALALLKENGWHMLAEDADGIIHGLPGDDGQYLMTDGEEIWVDDYVDGVDDGIFLDSGRDFHEIKAWMYMPEFPQEGRRSGMPDRETVITHLQIIRTWAAFAREHDLQFFTAKHLEDIAQWSEDAIAPLKELEEREKTICKRICDFIRGSCCTDTDADKDYACHVIQQIFIKGRQ